MCERERSESKWVCCAVGVGVCFDFDGRNKKEIPSPSTLSNKYVNDNNNAKTNNGAVELNFAFIFFPFVLLTILLLFS